MTMTDTDDQLAIRDLTARFTDAVNRRDTQALAATFAEDGEWHVPGVPTVVGRAAIAEHLGGLLKNFQRLIQLTHSGHIDVSGNTAAAAWYLTEAAADAAGNAFDFTGVYTDALVRTTEGWRFRERSFAFLYRSKSTSTGKWYDHPRAVVAAHSRGKSYPLSRMRDSQ
jgi:uncharacterized protein (TIGR02246 family)